MLVLDNYAYLIADLEFYESLERYTPAASDFLEPISRLLPRDWRVTTRGVWAHCSPLGARLPREGWKIHLSATLTNAAPVLVTAARYLVGKKVPFKFLLDRRILTVSNSKRWPRSAAGKFVTLYPSTTEHCGRLLEELHDLLIGYEGPYILSDRRYRDCSVLYYRYGGIAPDYELDIWGKRRSAIARPDGARTADERHPYFFMPEGVHDPFDSSPALADADESGTLGKGRYHIDHVLAFSASGGVYLATERTSGEQVVLKEARPRTNFSTTTVDAVALLVKEWRLLTLLAPARIAPRPLQLFKDWEHYYMAEEYLPGTVLRAYAGGLTPALRTKIDQNLLTEFYGKYRQLFIRISEMLRTLHSYRITFSDLSHFNIIVSDTEESAWLIDFEGAHEDGVDLPSAMFTPGFAPAQLIMDRGARPEDDVFALGSLMLAAILPYNALATLDDTAHSRFLAEFAADFLLPTELVSCVSSMVDKERARRPTLNAVLGVLGRATTLRQGELAVGDAVSPGDSGCAGDAELLTDIFSYIDSVTTPDRDDRLFPADPMVFETNPLSIAHGACGVAVVQQRARGCVPDETIDWILRHPVTPEDVPPGLYIGMAGIAWSVLELGMREHATALMRKVHDHPLLWKCPDLFYGVAGWGMADLKFFLETQDESFLRHAEQAGEFLVASREDSGAGCVWSSLTHQSSGLGHGASGVALFMLYLYYATRREVFLDIGRRAVAYVIGDATRSGEGFLSWRASTSEKALVPYWRWGSAGIGIVLLRYLRALGDPQYRSVLEDLWPDVDRKYSIFPGQFFGLAGMGEFFMDAADFGMYPERALAGARRVLSGMRLYAIRRPAGVAFPGETRFRISCDFGTGSAGVAAFLDRTLHKRSSVFKVDELIGAGEAGLRETHAGMVATS